MCTKLHTFIIIIAKYQGLHGSDDIVVRIMETLTDDAACMQLKILVEQHGQCGVVR